MKINVALLQPEKDSAPNELKSLNALGPFIILLVNAQSKLTFTLQSQSALEDLNTYSRKSLW